MRREIVGLEVHLFAGFGRDDARAIVAGGRGKERLCAEIFVEREREFSSGEALGGSFGFGGTEEVEYARVAREIERRAFDPDVLTGFGVDGDGHSCLFDAAGDGLR